MSKDEWLALLLLIGAQDHLLIGHDKHPLYPSIGWDDPANCYTAEAAVEAFAKCDPALVLGFAPLMRHTHVCVDLDKLKNEAILASAERDVPVANLEEQRQRILNYCLAHTFVETSASGEGQHAWFRVSESFFHRRAIGLFKKYYSVDFLVGTRYCHLTGDRLNDLSVTDGTRIINEWMNGIERAFPAKGDQIRDAGPIGFDHMTDAEVWDALSWQRPKTFEICGRDTDEFSLACRDAVGDLAKLTCLSRQAYRMLVKTPLVGSSKRCEGGHTERHKKFDRLFDNWWAEGQISNTKGLQPVTRRDLGHLPSIEHGAKCAAAILDSFAKAKKAAEEAVDAQVKGSAFTLDDWMTRDLPLLDPLLGQWISTTCRVMIYGPTGLGKTNFGMAIAMHAAAGKTFLNWYGHRPVKALYIDGEMSRRLLKQRIIDAHRRLKPNPDQDACVRKNLVIFSKEDFEEMPPLNTVEGQHALDTLINGIGEDGTPVELIMFDNIQCLLSGSMKDEEAWAGILPWIRSLTARGIGQIWFHHTGHDESHSYGDKTKEWGMETVAPMKRVPGNNDLAFEFGFEKARERTPDNRGEYEKLVIKLENDAWDAVGLGGKGSSRDQEALGVLKQVILATGALLPEDADIPAGTRGVTLTQWRDALKEAPIFAQYKVAEEFTKDAGDDIAKEQKKKADAARRQAFGRIKKDLEGGGKIKLVGELVWDV